MLQETVLLAGNLVIRIFEHGSVLDEVADSVVYVVSPESTICHDLADLVTIVVLKNIEILEILEFLLLGHLQRRQLASE